MLDLGQHRIGDAGGRGLLRAIDTGRLVDLGELPVVLGRVGIAQELGQGRLLLGRGFAGRFEVEEFLELVLLCLGHSSSSSSTSGAMARRTRFRMFRTTSTEMP